MASFWWTNIVETMHNDGSQFDKVRLSLIFFLFFDVDAILIQIIKHNDCVDVIKDFLAARLNYLLEHNEIVKKKYNSIESYSLNECAQTYD